MGSRARKKWQGDLLSTLPTHDKQDDDDGNDDSSSDDERHAAVVSAAATKKGAFAIMLDEESSSEEEEEEEEANDEEASLMEEIENDYCQEDNSQARPTIAPRANLKVDPDASNDGENEKQNPEEDLDAILDEFQKQDLQAEGKSNLKDPPGGAVSRRTSEFAPILGNVDIRDLDVDRSLRNALHGTNESTTTTTVRGNKGRLTHVFGAPPPNAPRPPHYVGGGMGMTSYDRLETARIPWPYVRPETAESTDSSSPTFKDPSRWYTFQYSDTYSRELEDYRQIEQSGDVNALLLFVAHHPFSTNALLQVVSVLNQTNHANEAQHLLKRCLWVYECAALQSFHKDMLVTGVHVMMDWNRTANTKFFYAIWQLVRQSITTGLHKSAWAIGRYLWGFDPWRDPMGVLLILDSVALSCQMDEADAWVIEMVENDYTRQIWYKESETEEDSDKLEYCGKLDDLPNWAFSYALALFRVHGSDEETSNTALRKALRANVGIVGQILQKLEVDTAGRSFRRDWVTVLDKATQRGKELHHAYLGQDDTITTTATLQAVDFISTIFLDCQTKSWGDDDVLQWLYDNLCFVVEEPMQIPPLCPALMRYARFKAPHYETRVQQFPADANIIDPGLVAHAMVVDANRPRLLRRHQQQQQQRRQEEAAQIFAAAQQQVGLGGPPTGIVDPDWPIAEVFWRSMLPWNHVEGVPPPRR